MKHALIAILSLLLAAVFTLPTVVLIIGLAMTAYCKWISGLFCLVFAWNLGKLVESKYREYLEKKDEH